MRRVLPLIAALAFAALMLPAPIQASRHTPTSARETRDCTVYVTRTGHRYHRAGCRYLRTSHVAMSRSEALKRGYTPCHVCGGSECE
jgi:hypothetical protein